MNFEDLRILIIDDVTTVRKILQKTLNGMGITKIDMTDSLFEAWNILNDKLISNEKIDIIFCDWNMPKGDGIHLLKKLRSSDDENLKWTKFIMVTGSNEKVLKAMDEGATNIIHKPFDQETIGFKLKILYK